MRQPLLTLISLILLAVTMPAYAEPACGSDTSSDPTVAMGKDLWLNGFCKSFGPCRLVLEQFHTCEAAEKFLSKLGAEEGKPLTAEQVDNAISQSAGSVGAVSKAKAPMSKNIAIIEYNRIVEMDTQAASLLQSNCGGLGGCGDIIDGKVQPLINEVEKLNADPEYLAHMPKYSPIVAVETAARFGWTRENGGWVNNGLPQRQADANTSTLGNYLLSVDECKKLRDRLDQAIKVAPTQEPTELSFFEAECVPQLPDDRTMVAAWRSGFRAAGEAAQSVAGNDMVQSEAHVVPDDNLSQWNNERVAEEQQYQAAIEWQRRAAAAAAAEKEKRDAEEAERKRGDVASEKAESERDSSSGAGRYETICDRDDAKLLERVHETGLKFYSSGYGTYLMHKLAVERTQRCKDSSRTQMDYYRDAVDGIRKFEQECGGEIRDDRYECRFNEEDRKYIDFLSREQSILLHDPNYSASLGGIGGVARGSSQCERALDEQEEKYRNLKNNPETSGSVVAATQRAMFLASERIRVIKTMCADNPGYMGEIPGIEAGYKGAEKMCLALSGDPGACRPVLN